MSYYALNSNLCLLGGNMEETFLTLLADLGGYEIIEMEEEQ